MQNKMTFDQYINNPGSKGNAVVTNKQMYHDMYKSKFDALLVREQGKINFTVYRRKDVIYDDWYIHFKIPSEEVNQFYYDVVVQFQKSKDPDASTVNINTHEVLFFSNDPAFMYTFAYAFNAHHLLIPDLKSRIPAFALKNTAKIRNPNNDIFYVKSLYFAYLTMKKYNLFSVATLDTYATPYRKTILTNNVRRYEKMMEERNAAIAKQKKLEAQNKLPKENKNKKIPESEDGFTKITKTATTSKISNKTKTTKMTKTSKVIGKKRRK